MKRFIIFLSVILFLSIGTPISFAEPINETQPDLTTSSTPKDFSDDDCDPTTDKDCYQLLESIPLSEGRTLDSINTTQSGNDQGIGGFINFMFEMGIGIAGVLGVIMLVIYGFQYAANDKNINTFGKLKEKIGNVILGLLLLLSIFIILNTINPDLLLVEPEIQEVSLKLIEQGGAPLSQNQIRNLSNNPLSTGIQYSLTEFTNDKKLIAYINHQQGSGGLRIILKSIKTGNPLPSNTLEYMKSNLGGDFYKIYNTLTAQNFMSYWKQRVAKISQNVPEPNAIILEALSQASYYSGVDLSLLKTVSYIESTYNPKAVSDNGYYKGLFQLRDGYNPKNKAPWSFLENYPKGTNIFDPKQNAFSGAINIKKGLQIANSL
jgi:hypothetical protein